VHLSANSGADIEECLRIVRFALRSGHADNNARVMRKLWSVWAKAVARLRYPNKLNALGTVWDIFMWRMIGRRLRPPRRGVFAR